MSAFMVHRRLQILVVANTSIMKLKYYLPLALMILRAVNAKFIIGSTVPSRSWSKHNEVIEFNGFKFAQNLKTVMTVAAIMSVDFGKQLSPPSLTFPTNYDRSKSAALAFMKGKTIALVNSSWAEAWHECSLHGGNFPEMTTAPGLKFVKDLLAPFQVTSQLAQVLISGGKMVYRSNLRVLDKTLAVDFSTSTGRKRRRRDVPSTTESPATPTSTSPSYLEWLKSEAKQVKAIHLTTAEYTDVDDPTQNTIQVCMLPNSVARTFFDNVIGIQKINQVVVAFFGFLVESVASLLKMVVSKKLEELLLPKDRHSLLPLWLSDLHSLLTALDSPCVPSMLYADPSSLSIKFETILASIKKTELDLGDDWIMLGVSRCKLGTTSRLACVGQDHSVKWQKTHIIPLAENNRILLFDHFVYSTEKPTQECGTVKNRYLTRFTDSCCAALNNNTQSENVCPSVSVYGSENLQVVQTWDGVVHLPTHIATDVSVCNKKVDLAATRMSDCPLSIKMNPESTILVQGQGGFSNLPKFLEPKKYAPFTEVPMAMGMIIAMGVMVVVFCGVCVVKCLPGLCGFKLKSDCCCCGLLTRHELEAALALDPRPLIINSPIPMIQPKLNNIYPPTAPTSPPRTPLSNSTALVPFDPNITSPLAMQNRQF
jgi:hypothetical protein